MALQAIASALLFAALCACDGGEPANDPGPAPGADLEAQVREKVELHLRKDRKLDASAARFRFAQAVLDEIPRWHFEPQVDGQTHEFGSLHGWRVDYWYTPEYVGYPAQPERHEMAFFGGGALRGTFAEGLGTAPLGLDEWHANWVDTSWLALLAARSPSSSR